MSADGAASQRFRDLEEEWTRAVMIRDERALERLLAADFTFTSSVSTGALHNKSQYLDFVLNVLEVVSFRFTDLRARVYGDAAVINARYHQLGRILGKEWDAEFLLTDVWVCEHGAWHAVARHSSQPMGESAGNLR